MLRRLLKHCYQATRRAGLLDVVRLMTLPGDVHRKKFEVAGYDFSMPTDVELRRAIDAGEVSPAVGLPSKLRDGKHRVVVARAGNDPASHVAAYLWLCSDRVDADDNFSRASHLGTSLQLPAGGAFIYNAWTSPQHRGRSLIAAMLEHAVTQHVLGAREFITTMDWTNESSRRAFAKLGMQDRGLIWRCGRGWLQFTLVPRSIDVSELRLAESAPGLKVAF